MIWVIFAMSSVGWLWSLVFAFGNTHEGDHRMGYLAAMVAFTALALAAVVAGKVLG